MSSFRRISILIAVLIAAAACDKSLEPDNTFISGPEARLTVGGQVVHTYSPLTWQLGYNPSTLEFRACDDSMNEYFFVTCSKVPSSLGQKLDATVTWSSGNSYKSVKGRFEVVKADGDAYWLWCGDKKTRTGVTVHVLR